MLHIVAMLTNHNNFIANRFEQIRQVLVSTTLYTIQNNFKCFKIFTTNKRIYFMKEMLFSDSMKSDQLVKIQYITVWVNVRIKPKKYSLQNFNTDTI